MNAPPPPVLSGKSRACQGLLRWSVDIIVCLGAMVNCFLGRIFVALICKTAWGCRYFSAR